MRRTSHSADRADASRVVLAAGEDVEFVRSETAASEGGKANADAAGGWLPGSPRECFGLWKQRLGKDTFVVRAWAGIDPSTRATGVLQSVQFTGSRTVGW